MKKADFLRLMDEIAPLSWQEEWDNSGMQIDLDDENVERVLVSLDITGEVIEEAIQKKVTMIVVHHPMMFDPIRNIVASGLTGDYIVRLIRAGISVYASHTCFDSARNGNNEYFMNLLNVHRCTRLNMPGRSFDQSTLGRIGVLPEPMLLSDFAERVKEVLGNPRGIKIAGVPSCLIQRVAVCTGAGGDLIKGAIAARADVFVSGDIKHHEVLEAKESGLCLIDAGHFNTEKIFVDNMAKQLESRSGGALHVIKSEMVKDPFDYIML